MSVFEKTATAIVTDTVANSQDQARAFYKNVILKAYGNCDVGDEPKHLWIRHEDEKGNFTYYRFPITDDPTGYKTRLTKDNDPKSREPKSK